MKKSHTRERSRSRDRKLSGKMNWREREKFGKLRSQILSREIEEK